MSSAFGVFVLTGSSAPCVGIPAGRSPQRVVAARASHLLQEILVSALLRCL